MCVYIPWWSLGKNHAPCDRYVSATRRRPVQSGTGLVLDVSLCVFAQSDRIRSIKWKYNLKNARHLNVAYRR